MDEKITLNSGEIEFAFPGNFAKLVNGEIVEIAENLDGNKFKDVDGREWKGSDTIAVAPAKEDLARSMFGVRKEKKTSKPAVQATNVYDYLGALVEQVTNKEFDTTDTSVEDGAKKAIRYIFDFLAGRDTVNEVNCIQEAITLLVKADMKVKAGKDDRTYKY